MIFRVINAILGFLTRPYISVQKYIVLTFQSQQFDEETWYILFGFMAFMMAYILSRCITLKDADDDPVYQRARFYSMQKKTSKN
jgi:hypothetical protein